MGSVFAALYLYEGVHQPWWVVTSMVLLTAALGVFLAIPMKRRMIQHEELPFPSGIAAAESLRELYSEGREAMKKARALVLEIAACGLFGVLKNLPALAETYAGQWLGRFAACWHGWMLELLKFRWDVLPNGIRISGFGFEPGVLMLGAGMIMGLWMALSMLLGSAYCVL